MPKLFGHDERNAFMAECLGREATMKLVPGIKPRVAIRIFDEVFLDVPSGEWSGNANVTDDDLKDCTVTDYTSFGERILVTPKGARLVRKLVLAGDLPMKRANQPIDTAALDRYIASEPQMRERAREKAAERARVRAERDANYQALIARGRELAEHPERARPEELSESLIDQVFLARVGYGKGGTIELAGCECHKVVDRYISNSGKTRSTSIRIWWTDLEGKTHGDPEAPVQNRRSDPKRNWGLGRE